MVRRHEIVASQCFRNARNTIVVEFEDASLIPLTELIMGRGEPGGGSKAGSLVEEGESMVVSANSVGRCSDTMESLGADSKACTEGLLPVASAKPRGHSESMHMESPDLARRMSTVITRERPDTGDAIGLIAELEAVLGPLYPCESRHGYSVEKLLAQGVAFFLLRADGAPAGCGGIQVVDGEYGEIKRMYVRQQFRGSGFAKLMLNHLADYARSHNVRVLRLETGIYQREAIGLYEAQGFRRIPPFGAYTDDPLSLYYEKRLT
jgi:GNAT superfamily N-acetyltransferase